MLLHLPAGDNTIGADVVHMMERFTRRARDKTQGKAQAEPFARMRANAFAKACFAMLRQPPAPRRRRFALKGTARTRQRQPPSCRRSSFRSLPFASFRLLRSRLFRFRSAHAPHLTLRIFTTADYLASLARRFRENRFIPTHSHSLQSSLADASLTKASRLTAHFSKDLRTAGRGLQPARQRRPRRKTKCKPAPLPSRTQPLTPQPVPGRGLRLAFHGLARCVEVGIGERGVHTQTPRSSAGVCLRFVLKTAP